MKHLNIRLRRHTFDINVTISEIPARIGISPGMQVMRLKQDSVNARVVKARYRRLEEMDDLALNTFDNMTLEDIDFVILE